MTRSKPAVDQARSAALIRDVIEDVMLRRERGEVIDDESVIAEHPELGPRLQDELALLGLLERARAAARSRSQAGPRSFEGAIEPLAENAFDGFDVLRQIHKGGQGLVYEAVQRSTGRRVAIKVMREGLFSGDDDAARFEREVRILGQLDHPGIVGILASGIRGGHFYYAMDFIDGVPLDEHARALGRDPSKVLELMERVADAANTAHLRGIIHRDLKPGNILVDRAGQPRILDFGLARIVDEVERRATVTGQFVGSMPWASPEQAVGDQSKIDLRTDVYSLGVVLYQALTGRFPYEVEKGSREALDNIVSAMPARPRSVAPSIDAGAEAITLKCLSKDPERRYQSAGELALDIRRYLSGRPVLAHPPDVWYQARMLARRHRGIVISASAVLAALLLGLVGTTIGLFEASAARRFAERERDEAHTSAYAASVAAADSALRVEDVATAKTQLRSAPESLRGWEWRYLAARADRSLETLQVPPVCDARVTPDGKSLLLVHREGIVSLLDLNDKRTVWSVPKPPAQARTAEQAVIGFSRDGSKAVTQHNGTSLVWDLSRGEILNTLDQPDTTWGWMSASFSPDGSRLATCGRFAQLLIWDLATSTAVKQKSLQLLFSPGADFSPDGSVIAVSDPEGVRLLDAQSLDSIRVIRSISKPRPDWGIVRYTPDGQWIVVNCGGFIAALDPEGKKAPIEFRGGPQSFVRFDLSRDGQRLVAGSWDRTVRTWDFRTGAAEQVFAGHDTHVKGAWFNADASRVVSTSDDGVVKVWESGRREQRGIVPLLGGCLLTVLPSGDRALFYGMDRVRLLDIESEREVPMSSPPASNVVAVSTSPDGRFMSYSDGGPEVMLWDLRGGVPVWRSDGKAGVVLRTQLSADGSVLASTHVAGKLQIRDARTGAVMHSIENDATEVAQVRFSPVAPRLAVGGYWGAIRVFDTSNWTSTVVSYPAEYGTPLVLDIEYSPDGSRLAASDNAGGVMIWEAASWKPLARLSGMNPATWDMAFSPDGRRLAVASQDRMVHLFETKGWREALILRGHTSSVLSLGWTPDGRRLLSTGNDGTVRIWDAAPAKWDPGRK